ncbi:hypothetical protein AN958_00971 [Leucoagaricus sp. SymC.cos]|nr:hypothetical protein AN958_00971 [Leucoagaricus sp. SymC.cos]
MPIKVEDSSHFASRTPNFDSERIRHKRPGFLRSVGSSILLAPLNVLNLIAVNGVSVLRPYAPQLVPILVCLFLVPFAVCLSLFAGWRVWKSLSVVWEVPLYLQYGERAVPYALAVIPPIQASQPYDISLHMMLPVSDSNMSLGNFMTTLTLMTPSNETLATVSRPALVLPPTPGWIFKAPNAINLDMMLFDSFIAKTSDILAYIEVGRRDGWKSIGPGQGREVSIMSAVLRGKEIPRGIRGLAIRFPLVASSLATCIFLLILSLMIGTCVLPTMFPIPLEEAEAGEQAKTKNKSEPSTPPVPNSRPRSYSAPLRQRRFKSSQRVSGSSRAVAPKAEENTDGTPVVLIPSSATATDSVPEVSAHITGPSGSTERLRRRTLRQMDGSQHSKLEE